MEQSVASDLSPAARDLSVPGAGSPIQWYARPAVEEFLAAAAGERRRLEALVAEGRERIERVQAASRVQETMVAMLLETEHAVRQVRSAAEREAAMIIAAADAESVAILGLRRDGSAPGKVVLPEAAVESEPMIDLVADSDIRSADFLEFLRGALVDDQPLGPRPE